MKSELPSIEDVKKELEFAKENHSPTLACYKNYLVDAYVSGELAPTMSEEEIVNILEGVRAHSELWNAPTSLAIKQALALSGKLPKQPCYSEDELLKMMPPSHSEDLERYSKGSIGFELRTLQAGWDCAKKEIAKVLANRLQNPRKVDRDKFITNMQIFLSTQTSCINGEYKTWSNILGLSKIHDVCEQFMKEIGDE